MPLDLGRFYRQAHWLGKCAELVYPPAKTEKSPPEYKVENDLDKKCEEAKRSYKKLRPWWKVLSRKTDAHLKAQEEWHAAEQNWAEVANDRITQQVGNLWVHDGDTVPNGFKVEFISCIGTQYFVARDDRNIIICFRGTEPKKRWDIFSDILSLQAGGADKQTGRVHLGFWTALDHVWGDVGAPTSGQPLPALLGKDGLRDKGQTVWFTGHSLGGALATLAADRLLVGKVLTEDDVGGVFTFGQPRVGDGQFAKGYQLANRHFRFINNNDAVTRVPPKSLWLVSLLFGKFFKRASQPKGSEARWTLNYCDVGRVALANRSGDFKLLKPGKIRWRFQLFFVRMASRFKALFRRGGFFGRVFPGLPDHSMVKYNRALLKFGPAQDPDTIPES